MRVARPFQGRVSRGWKPRATSISNTR